MSPADAARPIVRFQRPWMPPSDAVERYFAAARESRWFANGGPCVTRLRERLEERVGASCIPVANGTLALFAAIVAAQPKGRTVILPSFTFVAVVQAVRIAGLAPAFVDVDPEHWHLDPARLEDALARHDVALVLACSSFGTPPPPNVRRRWETACADYDVPLVIDSAAGFGAMAADGVPIGRQGTAEIVSFHATKPFAIGEGGAVFSRNADLMRRVARTVNFGLDAQREVTERLGVNGKLSEAHAAIGLAVLDEIDAILERRRAAAARLRATLSGRLAFQQGAERSTWQFVPAATEDARARAALLDVAGHRVELRTYYEPLHEMAAFAAVPALGPLDVTRSLGERMVSLPMANDISQEEIETIVEAISAA